MLRCARTVLPLAFVLALGSSTSPARGQTSDTDKDHARALYVQGVDLVKKSQWSDALAAFESSAKLVPHASTTVSIGSCERALGRYVRARSTFARALEESVAAGGTLPESSVVEAQGFVAEIDGVLARVAVSIEPAEAAIAVDGRPLVVQSTSGARPLLGAGVLPPGPGTPPPARSFDLVLDPGAHVFTLSRKGFTDVLVNKSFSPGARTTLDLKLDLLPATIKITSTQPAAVVRVDDSDVGPAPVDVLRAAGTYAVTVKKEGFVPYQAQVTVKPGEEAKLRATLTEDKPSVFGRWWFWSGAAAVIAGGVIVTYVVTRPAPQPPPYDGGSTGWVAQPSGFRF